MDSNDTNSRIPELRFPGFEGEWPIQPLSKFLHEHKTKSDGKCRVHSVSVSKGVVDQIEYLGRSFAASDTSKYNLARSNDIIYTKSPTGSFPYGIIKMNKNPYNVIVSPLYGVYSPTNKYIGYIIDSFFESPERTNTYLSTLVQKGAKNTIQITNNTFISKNVCFPTDEAEQQKIADCLSSVDNLIQAEADQLQALKDHKKGLMQQLFPQDGETTPKLRFPGFEGEWEEKKLGEVADRCTSRNKDKTVTRVLTNSATEGVVDQNAYFERDIAVKENTDNYFIVDVDDFVYNPRISVSAPVGPISRNKIGRGIMSPLYSVFRFKSGNIDYLEQFFNTTIWHKYLKEVANYGARFDRMAINTEDFYSMPIPIPSPPEQQKIAECLSSLDEEISAQQQKVEALKEHKKGLMQKLFPAIN